MKFDGYDFIILGVGLGLGSGILFAKAYLVPSFPVESAQAFFGANPFLVRNSISTRHEAYTALIWMILASVATLIGTVRTTRAGHEGYLVGSWLEIMVLLAALFVLGRITILITDRTSRSEYLPVMVQLQQEAFEQIGYTTLHGGLTREESKRGVTLAEHIVQERLDSAGDTLTRIGVLLDEPRRSGEGDEAYARRLADAYFPAAKLD